MTNAVTVEETQQDAVFSYPGAPANGIYTQTNCTYSTDFYQKFIEYTDRKDTTVKGYLTCIRQFAKWLDNNDITQPKREDIKAYRAHLETSGLAVDTQAQYLRAVKHFFRWTAAEGLYPNIAENIHAPKIRRDIHKRDALEKDAVAIIADSIDRTDEQGKRLYCIYLLCITCGLRCVEVHRADLGDIHKVGDKTYLYIQGKGHDEKDAPVLLIPEVKDALKDYLQARTDKLTAKSPLFVSTSNRSKGQRIAPTTISAMLKKAMVDAGYNSSRITAHSLRHTSGTGAYKATGDLFLTQKHQRHADPATTEIYIHAEERDERDTEQQVYNYYFSDDKTEADRREVTALIDELDAAQLTQLKEYINNLRKGA